jgi:hypothetical protein
MRVPGEKSAEYVPKGAYLSEKTEGENGSRRDIGSTEARKGGKLAKKA